MDGDSGEERPSPDYTRAEEMVDQMGQVIGVYATRIGRSLLKTFALAREEAEDIWAEAEARSREETKS
jgi:hypothetical protein